MNTFLPGAQDSLVLAAVNAGVMMAWSSFGQDAGGLGVRGRLLSGGAEFGVNAQEKSRPIHVGSGIRWRSATLSGLG